MTSEAKPAADGGAHVPPQGFGGQLARASFALGSVGLLGAMLIDTAAVIGRHAGVPLLGSIELAETCIVWMACASLIGATIERGHASVHILTERLAARNSRALRRASDLLCATFFAVLVLGSTMVMSDLWNGDERSELLGIPIAPLRVLWCVSAAGVAVAFFVQAIARRSKP